ncbi:cupin domain-containing protein [Halomonas sp. CUBES01]|uniref:cupin domain-containing protein n=1 Tax=Halomonas sp. CUBES01 TaxID=2897340 RepID=UPI001E56C946|nr:cupin domain-containing protein [Halomonas sp. CUBES01]MEC4766354.1 cupin domain-containing protein [Halomonas sp. CUBES01]
MDTLKAMERFSDHPEAKDKILKLVMSNVELPDIEFEQMEPGLRNNVFIHILFDNKKDNPTGSDAALIKYLPGAFVPLHLHRGYEMVLVLQGEYIENGEINTPGSLIIRAPGTTHSMRSNTGCVILAMRDIPVKQLT